MTRPREIEVRLARTEAELDAAQRLRYTVFYEEWGARPDLLAQATRRDIDIHDARMDHLVVIDRSRTVAQGQVVGNYRLRRHRAGDDAAQFYSSAEFDIAPLLGSGLRLLELGRSCVLREYRSTAVLQLLWRAIAGLVAEHRIELMFGCASLHGTDPGALREQLAYLFHHHLAPPGLRPRAIGPGRTSMELASPVDIEPRRALAGLEPLIKGYLRLGAWVGEDACVDEQFNSVDVCIVMPTARLTRKYVRHYERVIQRRLVEPEGLPEANADEEQRAVIV